MPRKQTTFNSAAFEGELIANGHEDEFEEYVYYSPGCYIPPRLMPRSSPYTVTYAPAYPMQWHVCGPATYVVDAFGLAYYLSDLEQQLPVSMPVPQLPIETTYTYTIYEADYEDSDDNNSCKSQEHLPYDVQMNAAPFAAEQDNVEHEVTNGAKQEDQEDRQRQVDQDNDKDENKNINVKQSTNVYRAAEGYIVEEPNESEIPSQEQTN